MSYENCGYSSQIVILFKEGELAILICMGIFTSSLSIEDNNTNNLGQFALFHPSHTPRMQEKTHVQAAAVAAAEHTTH